MDQEISKKLKTIIYPKKGQKYIDNVIITFLLPLKTNKKNPQIHFSFPQLLNKQMQKDKHA